MCRFFKHLLLVFLIQQMAGGLFRAIAGLCRSMIIAQTGGALFLLIFFVLGGFVLPKGSLLVFFLFYSHRSIFSLLTSSLPSHC